MAIGARPPPPVSRQIAFIGILSAAYVAAGTTLGFLVGPALRGYPAHFFRGLLMSATAAYSRRMWSSTAMGAISGLIFLVTVPITPAPYLLPASIAAGVAYDLSARVRSQYQESVRSRRRILLSTVLSGLAESVVALAILTYVGLFKVSPPVVALIWAGAIVANILISSLGALTMSLTAKRLL